MEAQSLGGLELVHFVENEIDREVDKSNIERQPEQIGEGFNILDGSWWQELELKCHPVVGAHFCSITGSKEYKPDEHVDRQLFNPRKRERKQCPHNNLQKQQAHKNCQQGSANITLDVIGYFPEFAHLTLFPFGRERHQAPSVVVT